MRNLAIFAVFVAAASSANAAIVNYSAALEPYFETGTVNNVTPLTMGSFAIELNTVTGAIQGSFTGFDLSSGVTGFHIHQAPVGVSGPIIADLANLPRTFQNTTTNAAGRVFYVVQFDGNVSTVLRANATLASLVTALDSGNAYANMHTTVNPAGEIRGQIAQTVPEPASMAALGLGAVGLLKRRRARR